MALARKWDDLVAEIRALPGFTNFLTAPSFGTLARAADRGPVVMLNAAPTRCDAIVVRTGGTQSIALEGVTFDTAAEQVRYYLKTIETYQGLRESAADARRVIAEGDDSYGAYHAYHQARTRLTAGKSLMESALTEILEWLWTHLAEPVLTALGFDVTPGEGADWPRVWWCPVGLLTFLPVHAAGIHTGIGTAAGTGRSVIDRVVSSYTPTLRAMRNARAVGEESRSPAKMLVVAVPEAPGAATLANVDEETANLRGLLADDHCSSYEGAAASRREILNALSAHRFAHFCCHGLDNPLDPAGAGILLHDGLLSVHDIGAARFTGEFAFLSACKTATGVARLPDEAMSLAAALHYTGFRHVVATQWSVYDSVAVDISRSFYEAAVVNGRLVPDRSATALHGALRSTRDSHRDRPSTWIPYVHLGP